MVSVRDMANRTGRRNVIATDVGGTTFKVALITDGEWGFAKETVIQQYTLLTPMIDIVSIGAGGGSIAWVDDRRLRVGPLSAGADPGPACYRWGGTRPTVTDADLVLGFLSPDRFLGGRLRLDQAAARAAIRAQVAGQLFGGDEVAAAAGIRTVVDAQMSGLVRRMTVERGFDPRDFVLMSYGGAGPVHAASYARGLGITEVIVPAGATAYSAHGAASSDIRQYLQRSVPASKEDDAEWLDAAFGRLIEEAAELLASHGVAPDRATFSRWADARYERQLHDVRVAVPDLRGPGLLAETRQRFAHRYAELYGPSAVLRHAGVRLLRIGIVAVGSIGKPETTSAVLGPADPSGAETPSRQVFWPESGGWLATRVYDGERLRPGNQVIGPAVIEFWGTAAAVPEDAKASIDSFGNTVMTL
jgi:N-methylhydantoinase A